LERAQLCCGGQHQQGHVAHGLHDRQRDFILQGQAARLGLSTDLLLNNHDGHVMPLTYAVVWLCQDISGLNYGLVAASMLIGQAVLVASAVLALRSLLGPGMPSLVALAILLLNPIMLPGFTWWSSALTLVPLMSCMLLATVAQVHYLRTGSRGALITTYALALVALGFFEKSVLIPFWLFGVTVLITRRTGVWASVREALRSHWRMWSAWLCLLLVYLVAFAQVAEGRTHLPTGPGQVISLVSRAVFRTIAPGLVGGPFHWTPVDYSASFADPPWWLITFGALAVTVVVVAGVRRPGISRKAWAVAGAYLALDLATFAVGRLGPTGDPGVIQAGRYVATAMIGISIAIAATAAAYRPELTTPRWRWPLTGLVATVGFLALLSALAYAAIWSNNPAKVWVGNARTDLAASARGAPLLDQDVPDFLLLPVTHPYNLASWFLAPLAQQPGFSTSTTVLQLLDNRGRLVPAMVDGALAVPPPEGCYSIPAGTSATIPLEHALIAWLHTVQIDYSADRAGFINVSIGSGPPVAATVEGGRHQVFVRAEGGESSITVTATDASLCISGAEVGRVLPSDLPYGGGADISDQLQQLENGASG
jgi:hypothetical protein